MRGGNLVLILILILLVFFWLRRRARLGRPVFMPRLGRRPRRVTVAVQGARREAEVYASGATAGAPLLLCFHGGLGQIERFARGSGLSSRGPARGYVVAFPSAPTGWVDGRPELGESTQDLDFVEVLIEKLAVDLRIDTSRVFAIGVSNGGMFVERLAAERPALLAGGAAIIASVPARMARSVAEAPPLPFALICDRNDQIMPWHGGQIMRGQNRGYGGEVIPVEDVLELWVHRNRAVATGAPVRVAGPEGHFVDIQDFSAQPGGAPLRFAAVTGEGHRWPRWPAYRGTTGFDAGEVALDFFAHAVGPSVGARQRDASRSARA
ncbi:alpha/beta hydrolase family esterase [Ancylobacter pratisalsi]|uniref:Prolyl oligopeptidase family serine peptidase n=1 Tax=Ancylobacter pratisalsi TaxID=1745854 RepID=A0A6P1YNX5_9HYPH|nr:hypothetical protein [Ancylobacter pratisalsi]QIB35167.1 hypothetical protein G3A50_16715 [Ancylobacter pratisalsi]